MNKIGILCQQSRQRAGLGQSSNKQKLRSLTWKYFWQQKSEEMKTFFEVLSFFFFLLVLVSGIFIVVTSEFAPLNWQGIVILISLVIGCIFLLICSIRAIKDFIKWIKENWDTAKRRAEVSLREKK